MIKSGFSAITCSSRCQTALVFSFRTPTGRPRRMSVTSSALVPPAAAVRGSVDAAR